MDDEKALVSDAREDRPRTRRVPFIVGGGVVVLTLFLGIVIWRSEAKGNHGALASNAKPVTVVEARAATFRASHTYVGTLEPWVEARVGPQLVSAYVDTVLVRPGARVKRGDVLATLDCRNASATNQAVAMQARAIDTQQRAVASEAARMRGLLDGGFISTNEVELKTAMSSAEAAQLLSERAKMTNSALEVADCILRAPFDGEIATRSEDPGAFVRPGMPIVSVVDRSIARVTGDAPEVDFDVVAPGTPVVVHVLATGADVRGAIARRAPAADQATRTIHFEIDVPDPHRELPVGTTGEIHVDVGAPIPVTELPLFAASIHGDKAVLFVVEGDIARSRTVKVEGEAGGTLYLDRELPPGSRVVNEGRALVEDGDRVAVKAVAPPGRAEGR